MMKTFRKIKIKDEAHLVVDYIEIKEMEDGSQLENDITQHVKKQLHPDLINRMERLKIHFGLIAEFIDIDLVNQNMFNEIDSDEAYKHPGTKQLICNQVILTGAGDDKGVQLAGRKILRESKPLNCITPVVKLHTDQTWYPHKVDLNNDVEKVIEEVEACLNGKFYEDPQIEMNFAGDSEDNQISMNQEETTS